MYYDPFDDRQWWEGQSFFIWLAVLVILYGIFTGQIHGKPACDVEIQEHASRHAMSVAQAPVRGLFIKTIDEQASGGGLFLVDEGGEITSSLVQPGARTTWMDWKDLVLGEGEYEVQFKTGAGCFARARLEVH